MNATHSLVRLACLVVSICTLTVSSRAQTLTSGPGSSLVFDGLGQVVDITSGPVLGTTFTEEAWIFPTPADDNFHGFLGNQPATATTRAPSLFITNRTGLYAGFGDGSVFQSFFSPANVLRTNQWNHVAATYDGSVYRLFVNGAAVAETNINATPSAQPVRWLGRVDTFFPGRMDEVRIWNVARTTNEIQENMYRSLAGTETGLLAYYRLDEGGGITATDSAAAGGISSGTLTSAAMWLASTAPVTGRKATMVDTLLIDVDGDGKASPGDRLKYVVRLDNSNTGAMNNVVFTNSLTNLTFVGGSLTISPVARADGPTNNSAPGSPFHGAFNTTLNIATAAGLLTNDFLGTPAGAISSFGGGDAGGTVTSFAPGATANVSAGTLTVNADGSLTFVPATGFNGLFTFQYRLANAKGSSDATATIAIGQRVQALADARTATGNMRINTSTATAFSVLDNDAGDGRAVSAMSSTSAQGGQVAHLGNGQFTYNPPQGFEGADTFGYTITNGFGSSNATVTITVSGMIWFVDAAAAPGGDGRLTAPFNALTGAGSFDAGAADDAGDNIFLADGTYAGSSGLTLLNNQKLIGDGASGTLAAAAGITLAPNSDALPLFSGTDPVITTTTGNAITFGTGNTVRGITVGNTPAGFGFSGGNAGTLTISESSKTGTGGALSLGSGTTVTAAFDLLNSSNAPAQAINLNGVSGSITAASGSITNPTGTAVLIAGGGASVTYPGSITKNTAGRLIDISFKSGGIVTFNGSLTNNISTGTGIHVVSNTAGTIEFAGASKVLSTSGNTAVTISTNTGATINFSNGGLDVDTTTAAAFVVSGGGTVNVTGNGNTINSTTGTALVNSGSGGSAGIDINAAIGNSTGRLIDIQNRAQAVNVTLSGNLSNAGGSGILCNNNTAGIITFSGAAKTLNTAGAGAVTLTSNAGATINFANGGLDVDTTSGTAFSVTGGGIVNVTGAGNSINATTGIAFQNSGTGGNATIDINAGITNTTGRLIDIQNRTGGTVTLSGSTTNNGTGILVQNNSGGTINFNGAIKGFTTGASTAVSLANNGGTTINFANGNLVIATTSGTGFNASGGAAAINVTGSGNTIASGSGVALSVVNSIIGASGLTFQSVAANGAANGIVLTSTGSGALTVTGSGTTAGSGGIIQNCTGNGVSLTSAQNIILRNMNITNCNGNGVLGTSVTNFQIHGSTVRNNDADNLGTLESGIRFDGLLGSCAFSNITVSGTPGENVRIQNSAGTLTVLAVMNCTIGPNPLGTGGNGMSLVGSGTANMIVNVTGTTFTNNQASGFLTSFGDTSSFTAYLSNCTFRANNIGADIGTGLRNSTFAIDNCTFLFHTNNAVNIVSDALSTSLARVQGRVNGNTIGNGTLDSGSRDAFGIAVDMRGDVDVILEVRNNNVRNTDFEGIFIQSRLDNDGDGEHALVDLALTGNTVGTPDDNSAFPIGFTYTARVESRNESIFCADIQNNTASAGVGGAEAIRVRQRDTAVFKLERLSDGDATPNEVINNMATVEARVAADNPATLTRDALAAIGFTEALNGACRDVNIPAPPSPP